MDTLFNGIERRINENKSGAAPVVFSLLYQASREGFDVNTFHQRCDGKGPTLTVLYGKGVKFGGYTSISWKSSIRRETEIDPEAFLFCKHVHDSAKTFMFEGTKRKVMQFEKFGPTFGGSFIPPGAYDLQVFDERIASTETETDVVYEENEFRLLKGSLNFNCCYKNGEYKTQPNGGDLKVTDVQVFQVQDSAEHERKKEEIFKSIKYKLRFGPKDGTMFNILLVGNVGAGKSSFCNTLLSATSGEIHRPAPVAFGRKSITSKFRGYILKEGEEKLPIRVFDTMGIENDHNYISKIKMMLHGDIPDGYDLSDTSSTPTKTDTTNSNRSAKIHIVALVTDATVAQLSDKNAMAFMDDVRTMIQAEEMKLVIIATRFDLVDPLLKEFPDTMKDNVNAQKCIEDIANDIGVTTDMVIPFINYTNETRNVAGIDITALRALDVLITEAKSYLSIDRNKFHHHTSSDLTSNPKKQLVKDGEIGLNILCIGKSLSGKTSFVDSIMSALEETISTKATGTMVPDLKDLPVTRKVKRYALKKKDSTPLNIFITDMPGIVEEKTNTEIEKYTEKTKWIVEGHVKASGKGVKFEGLTKSSNEKTPGLKEQMHVVCVFFDDENVSSQEPSWEQTFLNDMLKWLQRDAEVPVMAILTKIDKIETGVDEAKTSISERFNIKQSMIFPVQNYVNEKTTFDARNSALIEILTFIRDKGYEYIESVSDDTEDD